MKIFKTLAVSLIATLALTACGDDNNYNANTRGAHVAPERSCQVFYDREEQGNVTQCFDRGNQACFTLYEPDGDTEYYCNGEKIWEIEPDDMFDGWGFDSKKYKKAKRPSYVGNAYKPKQKPPANYTYKSPTTKTNSKQALAAASKQTTTATPVKTKPNPNSNAKEALAAASKQTVTATKPKVDLTKKTVTKPKVDLTKPKIVATKPKVDLTKKTVTKPKVNIVKSKPKPKVVVKKKTCKTVNGKTTCK